MKQKKLIYYGLPFIGILICLWYVKEATFDIVYTDYIRLVNSYLPDVWNPKKFFVPDVLTRIPILYLVRAVNATVFGYSTTFDMALGVLSLGCSGLVLGRYCRKQEIGIGWFALLLFFLFGLDQWEMLTNGTGWVHFLAFSGFYYHYLVFDRVMHGAEKKGDQVRLFVLPFVITLTIAGPYCAVYTVVMVLFYGAVWVQNRVGENEKKKRCLFGILCVLIPFFLYLWSNSYAVEDHAGTVDVGLFELLIESPTFFLRFLLNALASMVVGVESLNQWLEAGVLTQGQVYLIGGGLLAGYGLAFYLNIRHRLYERSWMPLMLLVAGMGNHAIVLVSRYIFVKETYGMSSRYALQYQVGILGIVLTVAFLWKELRGWLVKGASLLLCLILFIGHGYTDHVEWKKAPYREAYGEHIAQVALQYESVSDEVLRETFDYRKSRPDSGEKVRQALDILKEQNWNIFGR